MKFLKFKNLIKGTAFSMFIKLNGGLLQTIGLFFATIFALHLAGCLFCALPGIEDNVLQSWIYRYNLQDAPGSEVYLNAFYFCLTTLTTVGYGDISAKTKLEILFSISWMLIGVAFYSLVIGIISAFFSTKDTKETLLKQRLQMVDDYCTSLGVKEELQNKLKNSISYSSDKLAFLWLSSTEDIFSELSVQLKYEFLVAIHQTLITSCEFFRNRDISFAVRIVPLLKPVYLPAGEMIWNKDDYSTSSKLLI